MTRVRRSRAASTAARDQRRGLRPRRLSHAVGAQGYLSGCTPRSSLAHVPPVGWQELENTKFISGRLSPPSPTSHRETRGQHPTGLSYQRRQISSRPPLSCRLNPPDSARRVVAGVGSGKRCRWTRSGDVGPTGRCAMARPNVATLARAIILASVGRNGRDIAREKEVWRNWVKPNAAVKLRQFTDKKMRGLVR